MKHDINDKPTRQILVRRYLDGATTVAEERALAAYYRTNPSVTEDERGVAAMLLAFDGIALPQAEEPSGEAVDEFDRLMSTNPRRATHRAARWHVGVLAGCAAAAAVAVFGYFIVRPADSRDATATQLASVAAVTQSVPASENVKTSASPEIAVAATPRKQTAKVRRHRAKEQSSPAASGGGTDLARVLDVASASCVNASIERKGNVFWVSSAAADGTVNVCIIDASNASDVAVYALSDADRPNAERGIDTETGVHGPNL